MAQAAEFTSSSGAASSFHVGAGGLLLLHSFTVSTPIVKEFILPVDSDILVLPFVPDSGSTAFVNAIELVSVPEELVGEIGTLVTTGCGTHIHGILPRAVTAVGAGRPCPFLFG